MNVSPIHIKVNRVERELFEMAAKLSGVTITEMVKKAVVAYTRQPLPKDEFAEALANLKSFMPTEAQLVKHRQVRKSFENGTQERGLDKKGTMALLRKMKAESKKR